MLRLRLGRVAEEDLACRLADALELLGGAREERVVVRDDELRLKQHFLKVGRNEVALLVVVVARRRFEHLKPIADRDARSDDQELLGEPGVTRLRDLVDGLPGDQHRHHHGLAGAGRHLQPDARQPVVVQDVLGLDAAPEVGMPVATRDLGEIDRGFGRLALAEKRRIVAVGARRPMQQQLAGVRGDVGVVPPSPTLDLNADVVDERVDLDPIGGVVEVERDLFRGLLGLLRHRDRDERLARPSPWDDHAGRAMRPQLEVARRRLVGRVQNRIRQALDARLVVGHAHPN